MTLPLIPVGNEGIKITINVKNADGSAKNLTGAANLKIKLKSSVAEVGKTFTATIDGDPTDGAVTCTTGAGDIDAESIWEGQAFYELGVFKGHTERVDLFEAQATLA